MLQVTNFGGFKLWNFIYKRPMHSANTPYYGYGWTHITNPTFVDNVDQFVCGSDTCCVFGLAGSGLYFIAKSYINSTGGLTTLSDEILKYSILNKR
jgi:hypothetical protein